MIKIEEREIQTLKNRVDELENQINILKQLILDSTKSSGHFHLSGDSESFLYTKVGDE